MTTLPLGYEWLGTIGTLPKMVSEALKLHGTQETIGPANNPVIMGWAQELGEPIASAYTADLIPWCGLFMAIVARRSGKTPPKAPLWALNWATFGVAAGQPMLGDVLVLVRPGGGHVGLYIGESADGYHVLAGNQGDEVCIRTFAFDRLKAVRRPPYMAQPRTVAMRVIGQAGVASTHEA